MMIKSVVLIVLTACLSNGQTIVNPPKNTTVKIGEDARLNCTVDGDVTGNPLSWKELISAPLGALVYKSDMFGPNDPEDYMVEGTYDLIVKDAEIMDAGVYTCSLATMDSPIPAQLIVVDEPVILEQPMELHEGQEVSFGCSVKYGAPKLYMVESQLPVFRASIRNRIIEMDEDSLTREVGDPGKTASSMSAKYTFTALPEYDEANFNCTVVTEDQTFSYTTSHTLSVRHETTSINIVNKTMSYEVGSKIVCAANGNPQPQYKWIPKLYDDKMKVIEGSVLPVTSLMIGSNEWDCVALDEDEEIIVKVTHAFKVESGELNGAGRPVVQFILLIALSWLLF